MTVSFEWDARKAVGNFRKHSVGFDEAATVFDNPSAVIFDDEGHSVDEVREIIIGHSARNRLLLVYFTERPRDVVRIICARPANRKERRDYEENISR
jgi:uncharacterized DUF497 family protein